ncbi:hypothetical protein [Nocardia brasiliensis]|uniref:hypothetical protein n=1 Tax=Nocardia brasiliensis TaxID=37326 RepID=UPI0024555786|nr:hypothetical protein [Nocardia brasiliensis]
MKFQPDRAGVARYLKTSAELRAVLAEQAEITIALYRAGVRHRTGRNAREVRFGTRLGGAKGDRWIATVHAYARYAAYREWGTRRNRSERGLRDALAQLDSL